MHHPISYFQAVILGITQGIAEPFPISGPAISRHLKVLEEARLIARSRNGQQLICRLNPEGLKTAQEWLDHYRHFWGATLDRLADHLKGNKP